MAHTEIATKLQNLAGFLERHQLDGVLLTLRANFSWITGGRDNHIPNNSAGGVATIFATANERICLANTIETPRFKLEELLGTDIPIVTYPWWDMAAARKVLTEVFAGRRVATDDFDPGLSLPRLPGDFAQLRWSLTPEEIVRYNDGARRATAAMEATCREISIGNSEHEIAGILDYQVHAQGLNPVVTLVAVDDRIEKFRHPIPTDKKLQKMAMLVTCGEFGGLISNLTRFVSFQKLTDQQKALQQSIANIDATVNLATRPGRPLNVVFADLQKAYADNGQADQWQLHHQGGSTGYLGREIIANPDTADLVREYQAFAWNPSIVGHKSEDTILVTPEGTEVLTTASKQWPMIEGHYGNATLLRPDILVR